MQKRIRFTLSVLDGADVLQGDLDAAVRGAEELDEVGILAVLGREGELAARVGANLVALGDPLGHGLLHHDALGQGALFHSGHEALGDAGLIGEHLAAQLTGVYLVGLLGVYGHVGLRPR